MPIVFVFFGFGSEMWGGFIFFKGKERPMGLISHTSHTLIIQSFQHSSWITSAHSLVHLVQILKHLCEWKLSLPVQSEMKQAPGPACIISYEKKEQILRKHHKSVSQQQQLWETKHHQQVDLRYCKQMNIYIDIYINKGIVAVDCTESQLLIWCCMPCFSAFRLLCKESVLWDIKALDGPEATRKQKILQSFTQGGMKTEWPTCYQYVLRSMKRTDLWLRRQVLSSVIQYISQIQPLLFKGSIHPKYTFLYSYLLVSKNRKFRDSFKISASTIPWR